MIPNINVPTLQVTIDPSVNRSRSISFDISRQNQRRPRIGLSWLNHDNRLIVGRRSEDSQFPAILQPGVDSQKIDAHG
jgi:hypothetical protein